MSFESVNVMNKQELGCNPSKTVEHGHDALDSRMSPSSDREEGEVEDGEIDDDEEGKVDEFIESTSANDKPASKPKAPRDGADSEDENRSHNSKRHKDRKRRHRKEKRHHHVSHKRHRVSPEDLDTPARKDHSPVMKRSRRNENEGRRPWDYDRPQPNDDDMGIFGMPPSHSNNGGAGRNKGINSRSSNSNHLGGGGRYTNEHGNDGGKRNRGRRQNSGSGISPRDNENERESGESNPSADERGSDSMTRMQDLFSDGDDLDLDVAAHERDGAFQRPVMRQERQGPKPKKKKKSLKAKEYWFNRQRKEEEFPRRRETERKRCRFYMEGRCGKADHCPYSHDFSPPKKLELCKFYAISSCLKGEYCVYMHDDFPCKFFHTGARVCKYEKNCKFSHDQLTRDTKKVLERFIEERPFPLGEDDLVEVTTEIVDERKNSLLGSPPKNNQDRNRNRGPARESSPHSMTGVCDPLHGSSPGLPKTQGPTPPPFAGQRQSPQSSQNLGPQPVPSSQQSPAGLQSGPANMTQHHRPFGLNASPDSMMMGSMNVRQPPPHMAGQMPMRSMGPSQGGPMVSMSGPSVSGGPMMMMPNRPQTFVPNTRMSSLLPQRPPANMLHPPGGPMHGGMMHGNMGHPQFGGMGIGGPGVRGQMQPDMAAGQLGCVDNQLDDLASMLVNTVKQQQEKQQSDQQRGHEDIESPTSMLKAAGADDSDLDEDVDSLDAMVHRMRKESEEQQRRQSAALPQQFQQSKQPSQSQPPQPQDVMQQRPRQLQQLQPPFQQYPNQQMPLPPQQQQQPQPQPLLHQQQLPPLMQQQQQQQQKQQLQQQQPQNMNQNMMMGRSDFPMGMGIRAGYNPQQMFNQAGGMPGQSTPMFIGNRAPLGMPRPVTSQPLGFPAQQNDGSNMENGAKQLYLRIAKQTASGRQEQLAREAAEEKKSPTAETPASPPPSVVDTDISLGPREWKLIPLDVPLKTPYPLMRLPHDLPYSRSDPRLTGQLRLVGTNTSNPPGPGRPSAGVSSEQSSDNHLTGSSPNISATSISNVSSTSPGSSTLEVGGRAYTPSMSNVALGASTAKDPRLGRQPSNSGNSAPEIPAALLQKPTNDTLTSLRLDIDIEPQPRPPPKMQLSERSSSFQPGSVEESRTKLNTAIGGAVPALPSPQAETRSYLLDPRFRRRKASVLSASGSTGSVAGDSDLPLSDNAFSSSEKPSQEENSTKKDTTPIPSSGESSPID